MPAFHIKPAVLVIAATATVTACSGSGHDNHTGLSPSTATSSAMTHNGHDDMAAATADTGTTRTSGGYTLDLAPASLGIGNQQLRFRILDSLDKPVTDYVTDQTKLLHLYWIRTDLTGYQHLHPTLAGDGTWSVPIRITEAGEHRLIADFTADTADGPVKHILGAAVTVAGRWSPRSLPAPSRTATVDGYSIQVTGKLTAGTASTIAIALSRDGRPVTNLQPYLESWAHLGAFRQTSAAVTHLHPNETPHPGMSMRSPDTLTFTADVPDPGRYRVFIQFQTAGTLHTAAVTLDAQ